MTSDQIMRRVSELVELARKDTAATMDAMRLQTFTSSRRADEASSVFFKAVEAFEKEVAEPLARLESERDGFRDALHPLMRETADEKARRHIEELELVAAERDKARAEVRRLREMLAP
jgi:hypothetical protein